MNTRTLSFAAAMLALIAGPALAHHSFSMFDRSKTVTLNGTVESLDWVNPHAWLLGVRRCLGDGSPAGSLRAAESSRRRSRTPSTD